MEAMDEPRDELELEWKKVKQNCEKIGYSDGIEEGRQSNFQKSFDDGYKSGFKNGFELGKLKGQLKAKNDITIPELHSTKLGNCNICKDISVTNKTKEEKEKIQWTSTQVLLASISQK